MESSKVKLPREIAESIGEFDRCQETNRDILAAILGSANSKSAMTIRKFACSDVNFEILLQALVNGYEVEQRPEERVAKMLAVAKEQEEMLGDHPEATYWRGKQKGILETLGALTIEIEGVNDHEK